MIIPAKPYISLKPLLGNLFHSVVLNSEWNECYFYPLGRDALLSAVIKLGLQCGDTILVPAYSCYSTIKPLEDYGFLIKYIDVDKNMEIDLNLVQEIITQSRIKAFVFIHYFGISTRSSVDKIYSLCRDHNVFLIEDCAHGFFSMNNENLGMTGDAAIYSLRKVFPVWGGGVLRMNNNFTHEIKRTNKKNYGFVDFVFISKSIFYWVIVSFSMLNIFGSRISKLKNLLSRGIKNNKERTACKEITPSKMISIYLSNQKYINKIKEINRKNYIHLSEVLNISGVDCFRRNIDANIVPQALPIISSSNNLFMLRNSGIGAYCWPGKEMPPEVLNSSDYINANFFNKDLIILPIHQSIRNKHMLEMLRILKKITHAK